MLDSLIAAGMSPPQFEDRIFSFTVTFPNHTMLSEETVSWIASLGQQGLSDSQYIALALLREQGSLDNRAYRTATGVDSRIATAGLQDLVALGLLVQAGTGAGPSTASRPSRRAPEQALGSHRPALGCGVAQLPERPLLRPSAL